MGRFSAGWSRAPATTRPRGTTPRPPGGGGPGRPRRSRHSRDARTGLAYVAPALIIVAGVSIFPVVYTLYLSFTRYRLTSAQRGPAGLDNYLAVLGDPIVQGAFLNTVVYTVTSVALSLVLGMALAELVSRIGLGKRVFRTVFFMPMLLAPSVVGVMWRFLFNDQVGLIPFVSRLLGYQGSWLANPTLALASVIIVDVWQWTPFVFLILLAGLDSLPEEPVEAARIDGANIWQIFWYITLPGLRPLISIALVFRVTWAFRSFDQIYTMTQGGPGGATEVLSLAVWRKAFVSLDFGQASAIAMLMFAAMTLVAALLLRQGRRERAQP